ncbi:MAG: helix-turn-helix domain-containing protein [Desulfomonilia bacterium]
MIIQALNRSNWVKNRAAKLLHVNRTTLVEKIKKQKLQKPAEIKMS